MSLINTVSTSQPTLTTAQKQSRTVTSIKGRNTMLFRQMVSTFSANMADVWENSYGLTPQEVMDGFKNDAAELCSLASNLAALINATSAGTVSDTPPQALNPNSDGSVTVGTPSGSSSSSSSAS